jgi:hypothetical protein
MLCFTQCTDKNGTPPKSVSASASASGIDTAIQPGRSVGKVETGMSRNQVIEAIGEPDAPSAASGPLHYRKAGFAVICSKKDHLVTVIMCGDPESNDSPLAQAFTGKTPQGIGMGSSRAEIVKAYGLPDSEKDFLPGHPQLKYRKAGLTFTLGKDRVHHIIVDFRGVD